MIKAPDRIGCATDVPTQHLAIMWEKARRLGRHLDAAIFIGVAGARARVGEQSTYGVDEFGVAGALNGAAIELVKAEMSIAGARIRRDRDRRAHSHRRTRAGSTVRRSQRLSRPRKLEKIFELRQSRIGARRSIRDRQRISSERKHGDPQNRL